MLRDAVQLPVELQDELEEPRACDLLWPWLGPPLVVLRYVMYFRFIYNVTYSWARHQHMDSAPCSNGFGWHCDTRVESDVYECLFMSVTT